MQRLKNGATPEFLGEEAYRVVEMVLGAEINYEKVDLVKLFTRCAERAIQEKVNKDTQLVRGQRYASERNHAPLSSRRIFDARALLLKCNTPKPF